LTAPPAVIASDDDTYVFDVGAELEVLFLDEDVTVCTAKPLIDDGLVCEPGEPEPGV
jgi:hypothetical protein